jgi:hypothetical protein
MATLPTTALPVPEQSDCAVWAEGLVDVDEDDGVSEFSLSKEMCWRS